MKKRITILHICTEEKKSKGFGGGVGGINNYSRRLLELQTDFSKCSLKLRFSYFSHPWGWPRFLFPFELITRFFVDLVSFLIGYIRTRPDIVHIHGQYWLSIYREVFYSLFLRVMGVPYIYEMRAGAALIFYKKSSLNKGMIQYIAKGARVNLLQSPSQVTTFKSLIPNVHFGLSPNFADKQLTKLALSVPQFITREKLCVYVGYVSPYKNVQLIKLLAENNRSYQFVLIGQIDEKETIRPSKNLHLVGRQDRSYIYNIMMRARFFVFPSAMIGEGMSNAVVESIFLGATPILYKADVLKEYLPPSLFCDSWENLDLDCVDAISDSTRQSFVKDYSANMQLDFLKNIYNEFDHVR